MIANHIHDALAQVKKLQEFILQKRLFKGYSGYARIIAGTFALIGTTILASERMPRDFFAHLAGWGAILIFGIFLNYGYLIYWFFTDKKAKRNLIMLKPALDAIPALGVGGVLSVALVCAFEFDMLFGTWMCLYGLAQVAYRQSLPFGIYIVGIFYIACGTYCLIPGVVDFLNPWPMGLTFFVGELAGGAVLISYKSIETKEELEK